MVLNTTVPSGHQSVLLFAMCIQVNVRTIASLFQSYQLYVVKFITESTTYTLYQVQE